MTDDRPRVRPQPPRGRWLPFLASLPGLAFIALPIGALLWLGFSDDAMRAMWLPASLQAMRVSLTVATSATLVCVMLGLPIAWWLSRDPRVGARLVRGLAMTPLVMPPVVAGTGLLLTLGRKGLLGAKLDALGLSISFTSLAAVLAAAFVSMPLIILSGEAAFRSLSPAHDEVARTLGAGRYARLRHIVIPQLRRPLFAATALCFGRALGEFGATITFAGSFPGRTRTVPLAVYQLLQGDQNSAVALSVSLIAVSFLIMILSGRVVRSP